MVFQAFAGFYSLVLLWVFLCFAFFRVFYLCQGDSPRCSILFSGSLAVFFGKLPFDGPASRVFGFPTRDQKRSFETSIVFVF